MKNNNNIPFDQLIKNTFEGAQSLPPAGVWGSVASQVSVSTGASIATTTIIKTIMGKVIVGSIVVALSTIGIVKIIDTSSTNKAANEEIHVNSANNNKIANSSDIANQNQSSDLDNSNNTTKIEEDKKVNVGTAENFNTKVASSKIKTTSETSESTPENTGNKQNRVNPAKLVENGMLIINAIDSVYCIGESIRLHAYYQPIWEEIIKVNSGATVINSADKNWVLSYAKSGKYQVVLIGVKNGINYSATKNIYIEEPKAEFTVNHAKTGVTLTARSSTSVNYKWSINDTEYKNTNTSTLFIPYLDFNKASEADIQLEIRKGNCTDTKTNKVIIPKEEKELFIPNVFTPTVEDGKNDCFKIAIEETTFYYLVIKNRNGNIVFESQNAEECWNGAINNKGEKCAPDAYFYQLIYQKENNEKKTLTGRVQLF